MDGQARIFGIGLSRTGTTSLTAALQHLGINSLHYPHDLVTHSELAAGQYDLSILEDFQAITDITAPPFYPQFDAVYPGSKFILTVRETGSWLKSVRAHFERLVPHMEENPELRPFTEFICAVVYGTLKFNEGRMTDVYETHLRNVRSYFANRPEDLLVIDICAGQGWKDLCSFLGCDVPSIPFPHKNRA